MKEPMLIVTKVSYDYSLNEWQDRGKYAIPERLITLIEGDDDEGICAIWMGDKGRMFVKGTVEELCKS